MRKLTARFFLLLFLTLVAVASAETYKHPSGAFSLTPPSGWKLGKDLFANADKTEVLNMGVLDIPGDRLSAWGDGVFAKSKGSWKHLRQKPASLAGAKAVCITGDGMQSGKAMHIVLLLAIKNGKGVALTFVRENGDQDDIDKLVKSVTATFKWL